MGESRSTWAIDPQNHRLKKLPAVRLKELR